MNGNVGRGRVLNSVSTLYVILIAMTMILSRCGLLVGTMRYIYFEFFVYNRGEQSLDKNKLRVSSETDSLRISQTIDF